MLNDMDSRRDGDRMLASLDKRLALVEQAQTLGEKTAETRHHALERTIEALSTEVRASLAVQAAAAADLSATPAGRAVLAALDDGKKADATHDERLDKVEDWVEGFKGSLSALRALIVVIGGVASLLAGISLFLTITGNKP